MIQHPARGPRKEDALPKELSAGLGDEAPLDGDARSRGNFSEGRVQQTAGGIAAGGPAPSAPRGRTAIPPGTITSRPVRRKRRRGLPGGPIKKAGATPQKGLLRTASRGSPRHGPLRKRSALAPGNRRLPGPGFLRTQGPPSKAHGPFRGSSAPARNARSPIPCASLKQAHPHREGHAPSARPPVRRGLGSSVPARTR